MEKIALVFLKNILFIFFVFFFIHYDRCIKCFLFSSFQLKVSFRCIFNLYSIECHAYTVPVLELKPLIASVEGLACD